jgi:hypothetical protein
MGSKEEKKGSRQYFYTACNKDPQIIYRLLELFILMKSCKSSSLQPQPFPASLTGFTREKLYKLPVSFGAAQAAAPTRPLYDKTSLL